MEEVLCCVVVVVVVIVRACVRALKERGLLAQKMSSKIPTLIFSLGLTEAGKPVCRPY